MENHYNLLYGEDERELIPICKQMGVTLMPYSPLAAVAWILLGIYWLYTTVYVVCKASRVGTNAYLFGILTFFTNLFGVACLWGYIALHTVCPECGTRISVKDAYCKGCGKNRYNE